jgi:hypothetical protein
VWWQDRDRKYPDIRNAPGGTEMATKKAAKKAVKKTAKRK